MPSRRLPALRARHGDWNQTFRQIVDTQSGELHLFVVSQMTLRIERRTMAALVMVAHQEKGRIHCVSDFAHLFVEREGRAGNVDCRVRERKIENSGRERKRNIPD